LGAFAVIAPLVLAAAGTDYVAPHNFLGVWFPFAIVVAAGCSLKRRRRVGEAIAMTLCVLNVAVVGAVVLTPSYQRDNWRGALDSIGPTTAPRALVFPTGHVDAVLYYARVANVLSSKRTRVQEIDVFLVGRPGDPAEPWPEEVRTPARGFHEVKRRTVQRIRVVTFRSAYPRLVTASALRAPRAGVQVPQVIVQHGEN
jgi:hypothetical protein